jgi:hypothetical protein
LLLLLLLLRLLLDGGILFLDFSWQLVSHSKLFLRRFQGLHEHAMSFDRKAC